LNWRSPLFASPIASLLAVAIHAVCLERSHWVISAKSVTRVDLDRLGVNVVNVVVGVVVKVVNVVVVGVVVKGVNVVVRVVVNVVVGVVVNGVNVVVVLRKDLLTSPGASLLAVTIHAVCLERSHWVISAKGVT